jgi:hypothetical protein
MKDWQHLNSSWIFFSRRFFVRAFGFHSLSLSHSLGVSVPFFPCAMTAGLASHSLCTAAVSAAIHAAVSSGCSEPLPKMLSEEAAHSPLTFAFSTKVM